MADYKPPKGYTHIENKKFKCDTCRKETIHSKAGQWWYCLVCKRRSIRE